MEAEARISKKYKNALGRACKVSEPTWLRRAWVDALHFQQLRRFGGRHGVRDEGAIEWALARARNRWEYTDAPDLPTLAAAYGYGLTRGHGYADGNKRAGFVAMACSPGAERSLSGGPLDPRWSS